jgi:hypothetical protein
MGGRSPTIVTFERVSDSEDFAVTFLIFRAVAGQCCRDYLRLERGQARHSGTGSAGLRPGR